MSVYNRVFLRGNNSLPCEFEKVRLPRSPLYNEKVTTAVAAFDSFRFVVKGSVAGAAVFAVYEQGLLGSGAQGAEALQKARAALPPAIQEWTDYIGVELPPTPKLDFSPSDSWNKGVQTVMSALSAAPTRACEYTVDGWKYVKDLVK